LYAPRLPPLDVTSRPVAVKDIWGLYGRQKKSFLLSTGFQVALLSAVVLVGITKPEIPATLLGPIKQVFYDAADEPPRAAPQLHHGGGGGGDRSLLRAARGELANMKRREFVAPQEVPHNPDPIISIEPNIVGDHLITNVKQADIGDPFGVIGPRSNGTGDGNGIGDGHGGGQGPGTGPGSGPGDGPAGGFNNPLYVAGHSSGLTNPVPTYKPEPDYSEDARKAKMQGMVVLEVVVGSDGRPQIRKVLQSLGMGLDEQAVKAVSTWKFKPGTKDGKPVPVLINVLVSFRLL